MFRLTRLTVLLCAALWLLAHAPASMAQSAAHTLNHDGLERIYHLFAPENHDADSPTPLLIALHPVASSGLAMAALTGLHEVASDYLVAYPESHSFFWDTGRVAAGVPPVLDSVDDVGFIAAMIEAISAVYLTGFGNGGVMAYRLACEMPARFDGVAVAGALLWDYLEQTCPAAEAPVNLLIMRGTNDVSLDLSIDQQRIYVTGFSNGGFMTQRLACEAPEQFAAFASVGATGFFGMPPVCEDQTPVPMLLMHGTDDVSIPWAGQSMFYRGQRVYNTAPVQDTLAFWADHNGCDFDFNQQDMPPLGDSPGTQVRLATFEDCDGGSDLVFYAILGGGHNWPGVPGRISAEIAGDVNVDINASQVIWAFFQQFTRNVE